MVTRAEVHNALNKTNCAFALDGTCKLDENACKRCKVDKEASDFHKSRICNLIWNEIVEMQQNTKFNRAIASRGLRNRIRKGKSGGVVRTAEP